MTEGSDLNRRLVIDVCVAVKWFAEEEEAENARRLLFASTQLLAPDVFVAELGNALHKKVRNGDMAAEDVPAALLSTQPIVDLHPCMPLADTAFEIARRYQRSFYDALYVALAIGEGTRLVTSDYKLIIGLGSSFQDRFLYLRDV